MTKTLLEKALEIKIPNKFRNPLSEEELELLKAYINEDITYIQAGTVLKCNRNTIFNKLGQMALVALRAKQIKI